MKPGAPPGAQLVKNPPASAGTQDAGSVLGSGRSPGEGNGNPPQYSCLENSMVSGAWRATVHVVAKSRTRLSMHTHTPNKTRKSGGEGGLRGAMGEARAGERKQGPDRRTRGRTRRGRGSGGRIRAAPCFLGTAPPSPGGPPSQTSPRHRTQHRTLGAARVQSTRLQPQAVPRSPWGVEEAPG